MVQPLNKGTFLRLVAASDHELIAFDPPRFSLLTQPQRPGELAELIDIDVEPPVADRVYDAAKAVGLPVELALYIAVEADRALSEAVAVVGGSFDDLVTFLDNAANDGQGRGPTHVFARPLVEYAVALRRAVGEPGVAAPLRARVPHRVAASWVHAAAAAGMPFKRWLSDAVARADFGRLSWEAASARTGRSLSEWVLFHAARCARSRSTSPHTTASG